MLEMMDYRDRLIPEPMSGCHLWEGGLNTCGYGLAKRGAGRSRLVHRRVWEDECGPIPDGMCVLHKCDTPSCANPDHLYVGTKRQNTRDMVERQRWKKPPAQCGAQNVFAKLTDVQVCEIRTACRNGETQRSAARRHGVSESLVSLIIRRMVWDYPAAG